MALLLLALLPLALPWGWVCFGGLAGAAYHLGVSMRWSSTHGGLASGSSGSLTSRFERLVSLQGASDSVAHFSPEGVVVISGSGMAVRALLSPWLYPWRRVSFVRLCLFRMVLCT